VSSSHICTSSASPLGTACHSIYWLTSHWGIKSSKNQQKQVRESAALWPRAVSFLAKRCSYRVCATTEVAVVWVSANTCKTLYCWGALATCILQDVMLLVTGKNYSSHTV